jgi:hypothetical protein
MIDNADSEKQGFIHPLPNVLDTTTKSIKYRGLPSSYKRGFRFNLGTVQNEDGVQ